MNVAVVCWSYGGKPGPSGLHRQCDTQGSKGETKFRDKQCSIVILQLRWSTWPNGMRCVGQSVPSSLHAKTHTHIHTHTDINAYMFTHSHKKNKHAYLATADLISPIFSRAQKSPVVCSKRVSILQMLPLTTTYHVTSLLTDMWHRPHANPSEGLASHDHTHRCCLRPDRVEKDQLHRSLFSPQHPNECIKNAWVTRK